MEFMERTISAKPASRPLMPRQEAAPTLADETDPAKANAGLGDLDVVCQIELAVINRAGTLTRQSVSLSLKDALVLLP
jgi:hypothetical protein